MNDPIADLLTRMRNALRSGKERVDVPSSTIKEDICRVLKAEGYIDDYKHVERSGQDIIEVVLRYSADRKPIIRQLKRVSKPSLRVYTKSNDIRPVRTGLGISIVSTSKGVLTGKQARDANVGGEILCEVW